MFQRCHHKRRGESRLGSAEADGNDDPRHEILRGSYRGRDEKDGSGGVRELQEKPEESHLDFSGFSEMLFHFISLSAV